MRQALILVAVLSAALSAIAADNDLATSPIRFAILGDRTGGHIDHIYDSVVLEIARMRPDFVMTVGDMIEGYSSDTAELTSQWREYLDIVAPLSMPIHYTPGNHDITNEFAIAPFEEYIGEPVYSFDYRGLHIIVLDNSRFEVAEGWPQEQLEWLADDLKAHQDAAYTMVFFHKPFWYNTVHVGKPDAVHDICKQYGVDAVVCGHFHFYFSGIYDGIQYTAIGSSGAAQDPDTTYLSYHFGWVTVDTAGIHITPVRHGSVEPWDHITTAEAFFKSQVSTLGLTMDQPLRLTTRLALEDSIISLIVHNLSPTTALNDTLSWTLPDGWSIEPASVAVVVAPEGETPLQFVARRSGDLYPLPEAKLLVSFSSGRRYPASRSLRVARQATAYRAESSPTLDGVIDETCWQRPEVFMFDWNGKPAVHQPVEYYFAYDDANLYLAAICLESEPDSMQTTPTGRDAAVYTGDCVGYFLQPDPNVRTAYQIYISPNGSVFDQKITPNADAYMNGDQSWDGDYEVVTGRTDQGWTMEMRIPIAQFGLKAIDREWGVSFRRKQPRLGTGDWQLREGYDPSAFGRLLFAQ